MSMLRGFVYYFFSLTRHVHLYTLTLLIFSRRCAGVQGVPPNFTYPPCVCVCFCFFSCACANVICMFSVYGVVFLLTHPVHLYTLLILSRRCTGVQGVPPNLHTLSRCVFLCFCVSCFVCVCVCVFVCMYFIKLLIGDQTVHDLKLYMQLLHVFLLLNSL